MTSDAIAELLVPFLGEDRLSPAQLEQLVIYLGLLLRWNARINLTAVREPEHIVSRHVGESLFAAWHLLPGQRPTTDDQRLTCADLGSGAGFPGLPLKVWAPSLRLTLIESQNKKATFLREVIRALQLQNTEVFHGRGEDLAGAPLSGFALAGGSSSTRLSGKDAENRFDLVTLRAVERFTSALAVAISLLAPAGRLALLIGSAQAEFARNHARHLQWSEPLPIPLSSARVLLVGQNHAGQEPDR